MLATKTVRRKASSLGISSFSSSLDGAQQFANAGDTTIFGNRSRFRQLIELLEW